MTNLGYNPLLDHIILNILLDHSVSLLVPTSILISWWFLHND